MTWTTLPTSIIGHSRRKWPGRPHHHRCWWSLVHRRGGRWLSARSTAAERWYRTQVEVLAGSPSMNLSRLPARPPPLACSGPGPTTSSLGPAAAGRRRRVRPPLRTSTPGTGVDVPRDVGQAVPGRPWRRCRSPVGPRPADCGLRAGPPPGEAGDGGPTPGQAAWRPRPLPERSPGRPQRRLPPPSSGHGCGARHLPLWVRRPPEARSSRRVARSAAKAWASSGFSP